LQWADRHRGWLLLGVIVLYAASITGRWRVAPDTALYMSLGRSLAEGRGFTYHGVHHNWYEPGLPWVIGVSFRLFGEDNYLPLTLFILACGVASLTLAYQLFKRYAGRPTAVVLTVLLASAETFYRYCFQIVTDMPFLVGLFAVLLAYERLLGRHKRGDREPWWAWAFLFLGALVMCAFRPTILTFLGALALATAWNLARGPDRMRHALVAAVVVAGVLAFRVSDPRRTSVAEAAHREATLKSLLTERRGFALHRMFTRFIPEMLAEHAPEAVLGIELGTGVDQAFSVVVIALGMALVTRRPLWGAWVAATVAQMAFWLPRERYFLPILPLLLIALWETARWLESRLKPPAGTLSFAAVLLLLLVPNLLQDGVFVSEQRWRGIARNDLRDPSARPLVEMGRIIEQNVGEDDAVLAESSRQLTYFSRRQVVEPPQARRQPPTEQQEAQLEAQILSHRQLYAVMPEEWRQQHVQRLMEKLRLRLGPEIGRAEQPGVKGRPAKPPLTLHRLVREGAPEDAPATRAAAFPATAPAAAPPGATSSQASPNPATSAPTPPPASTRPPTSRP
jgi:hypothetical protein